MLRITVLQILVEEIISYLVNTVEGLLIASQVVVGHYSICLLPSLHSFDVDDAVTVAGTVAVGCNIEPIQDGNLGYELEHYNNIAGYKVMLYHRMDILNDVEAKMK